MQITCCNCGFKFTEDCASGGQVAPEPPFFMNRALFDKIKAVDPAAAQYLVDNQKNAKWRDQVDFDGTAEFVGALLTWSTTPQDHKSWRLIEQAIAARDAGFPVILDAYAYVAAKGDLCPACRSTEVSGHGTDSACGEMSVEMICSNCGASWDAVYKLAGYRGLTLP